jgi:hypothetical protein
LTAPLGRVLGIGAIDAGTCPTLLVEFAANSGTVRQVYFYLLSWFGFS